MKLLFLSAMWMFVYTYGVILHNTVGLTVTSLGGGCMSFCNGRGSKHEYFPASAFLVIPMGLFHPNTLGLKVSSFWGLYICIG